MKIELLGEVSIYLGIGIQVMTALLMGGLVGLDRERKLKSAGIKTNILICLGASLYTSIGILVFSENPGNGDPTRMAAQIVSGIGFLGAGAIIQGKGSVVGMTTAATIWVVAAIGFTIGAGYPISATLFTLTVLVVLKMIGPVVRWVDRKREIVYYQLDVLSTGSIRRTAIGIFSRFEIDVDDIVEDKMASKKDKHLLSFYIFAHKRQVSKIAGEMEKVIRVEKVNYFKIPEPPDFSE